MISKIVSSWKAMSTQQKVNLAVNCICDIGGGLLTGWLYDHLTEEKKVPRLQRICAKTAVYGLGGAVGRVAGSEVNDLINGVIFPTADATEEEEDDA